MDRDVDRAADRPRWRRTRRGRCRGPSRPRAGCRRAARGRSCRRRARRGGGRRRRSASGARAKRARRARRSTSASRPSSTVSRTSSSSARPKWPTVVRDEARRCRPTGRDEPLAARQVAERAAARSGRRRRRSPSRPRRSKRMSEPRGQVKRASSASVSSSATRRLRAAIASKSALISRANISALDAGQRRAARAVRRSPPCAPSCG